MNFNGLTFRKADLHLHTPRSVCYNDKSSTPEQIVETALACGLDAIAVTDHNTAGAIDDIRQSAKGKGLFVFPGIELSTKGGHVLAIFETDTPVNRLESFLDNIGVPGQGRADGTVLASDGIIEVFRKIGEAGGLAIAAHIERWPSGFLETNEQRSVKMSIHASQYLAALEITVPENKNQWNNGQARGYPKKYACIQGSDAHALKEIGRRYTYIQMDTVNLAALRTALTDYKTKIMFPNEVSSTCRHTL